MASIIRIKRSSVSGNPTTLAAGELAYSALTDNGSNGGDRLYIGIGIETEGNAANHLVIGGKFFTDRLDHSAGVLTASSAIVVDGDSKVDRLNVDNLRLDGNTLSTTNTNGDLFLTPNGTGKLVLSNTYVGDTSTTLLEYIQDATGGQLVPGEGIDIAYDDASGISTISAEIATDTNPGVAAFSSTDFSVTGGGVVSLVHESIQDIAGAMVSGTGATQNGIAVAYDDANGKLTFNVNDPLITITGDVDGSATMTNLGDTTINVTLDTVNSNTGSFGSSTNIPVFTVNGKGLITAVTTAAISSEFNIAGDTGSDTFQNGGTLTFEGTNPVQTAVSNDKVTISVDDSTTTTKGVASFATADFNVTAGAVELKDTVVKGLTVDAGATVTPANHSVSIIGGEGIDVTATGATITVAAELATASNAGVATFNTSSFTVTNGDVTIKNDGITNDQLVNDSVTIGSTSIALGSTVTSFAGLTELTVDNLNFNSNTIAAANSNGNIVLAPNGSGSVDVSGKKITGLATPEADTDAANKLYVDTVAAEGLHVQEGVDAATTNTLATLTAGTISYNNGSSGVGATLTTSTSFVTGNPIDGVVLTANADPLAASRVLVKNEVNRTHNGIYYLSAANTLTRDPLFDSDADIEGGDFVFVVEGTVNAGTGWVQTNTVNIIGTDEVIFQQFSGAGTYTAGSGLVLTGTEFSVNLAATGGIEFSGSNALQLKGTVAGNGLTLTDGVLAVVGTTNRISVSADAIDIAATYVGQSSITTVGTISTGTWQGDIVTGAYGGTGVNNNGKTITLGGNLTTAGAYSTTLTVTGNTNVTLPLSGTLATLLGEETISNKTITNSSIGSSNPSTAAFTTLTASGVTTFTNSTDASAVGTAAVVLTGGLSVAKAMYIGTNITGSGAATSTLDGFNIDGGTY